MPGVADGVVSGAALGAARREVQAPMGYDDRWLWLAGLALALVAVYYAVVLWTTRRRAVAVVGGDAVVRPRRVGPRDVWLDRLDRIEGQVTDGTLSTREGHQRISRTVREFVADATGLPAQTMTLADLRREGPERLVEVVELVYPPEFAPGERLGAERFGEALRRARELVETW